MATIKRPIKVYNGSSYDEIHASTDADMVSKDDFSLDKTNFNKFFGAKMQSDEIVNVNTYTITWNAAYPGMNDVTEYIGLDQNNGRNIKVLKDGYYLINAFVHISDMTGNERMWLNIKRMSDGRNLATGMSSKDWSMSAIEASAFCYLTKGETITTITTRNTNNSSYRIDCGETAVRAYPVYIP